MTSFAKVFEQVNGSGLAARVETFALDETSGGRGFGVRIKGTSEAHGVRVMPAADEPRMSREDFAFLLGDWVRERDEEIAGVQT